MAALDLSGTPLPAVRGEALARLAELRLAQGSLEEAERLAGRVRGPRSSRARVRENPTSAGQAYPGRSDGPSAGSDVVGENRLESALLLELLGEAEIGQGQVEVAAERGRKLAELGGTLDCRVMLAHGERLRGHALSTARTLTAKRSSRSGALRVRPTRDAVRDGANATSDRASPSRTRPRGRQRRRRGPRSPSSRTLARGRRWRHRHLLRQIEDITASKPADFRSVRLSRARWRSSGWWPRD